MGTRLKLLRLDLQKSVFSTDSPIWKILKNCQVRAPLTRLSYLSHQVWAVPSLCLGSACFLFLCSLTVSPNTSTLFTDGWGSGGVFIENSDSHRAKEQPHFLYGRGQDGGGMTRSESYRVLKRWLIKCPCYDLFRTQVIGL